MGGSTARHRCGPAAAPTCLAGEQPRQSAEAAPCQGERQHPVKGRRERRAGQAHARLTAGRLAGTLAEQQHRLHPLPQLVRTAPAAPRGGRPAGQGADGERCCGHQRRGLNARPSRSSAAPLPGGGCGLQSCTQQHRHYTQQHNRVWRWRRRWPWGCRAWGLWGQGAGPACCCCLASRGLREGGTGQRCRLLAAHLRCCCGLHSLWNLGHCAAGGGPVCARSPAAARSVRQAGDRAALLPSCQHSSFNYSNPREKWGLQPACIQSNGLRRERWRRGECEVFHHCGK